MQQTASNSSKVAILDLGAQYAKVIDRRVRELGVEPVIVANDTPATELAEYGAVIISGGPDSVYAPTAPTYDKALFETAVPIFGICYGLQLLNHANGGTVEKKSTREDGVFDIAVETDSALFAEMDASQEVLLTHGDTVDQIPEGFRIIARSGELIAGIEHTKKPWYGVQFHPEVDLTRDGMQIFKNFLFEIAGLEANYTVEDREEKAIAEIKEVVGDGHALVLVSGGVDSAVAAALVTKALGSDKVFALHVDSGFMRQNESSKVVEALKEVGLEVTVVDAEEEFLNATTEINGKQTKMLKDTTDPEEKRKIIGDTFMRISEREIKNLGVSEADTYLVQGTLRPDLIESASNKITSKAEVIKTHHNDTALVRKLRDAGKVIEPLADYHKDEVRQLGLELGLPEEIVQRHPFPGPGLAIRLLCATEPFMVEKYDQINADLQKYAEGDEYLTLLPVRSVGVQGDGRSYKHPVAVSGTADWKHLMQLAKELPKVFHDVNRVVYVYGETITEPTTDITPTLLEHNAVDQLRQADYIVFQELKRADCLQTVAQVPVISIPVSFGAAGGRSIVLRPFVTNDFMTGVPAFPGNHIPEQVIQKIAERILAEVPDISRVLYDCTGKPPGTTEWE